MNETLTATELSAFKVIVTMNGAGMKTSTFIQLKHPRSVVEKILQQNISEDIQREIADGTLPNDFMERADRDERCQQMIHATINEIMWCIIWGKPSKNS